MSVILPSSSKARARLTTRKSGRPVPILDGHKIPLPVDKDKFLVLLLTEWAGNDRVRLRSLAVAWLHSQGWPLELIADALHKNVGLVSRDLARILREVPQFFTPAKDETREQ